MPQHPMLKSLAIAAASCVLATAAPAQQPPTAEVEEMAALYDTLCLQAFPNDAALARAAAAAQARPLTQTQVAFYLHDDPGRGWTLNTPTATYVVTLELPPYHACAIRRMTPNGFPNLAPYTARSEAYASARHATLSTVVDQTSKSPDGADIRSIAQLLTPTRPSELLMTITTDYHGHYDGPLATDIGKSGRGVEIRFIHQFPPAPR